MYEKTMKLWDSKRADEITGGKSSEPWYCSGISIDTRTLEKGDLFVALVGEERDGHGFLQDAAYKGAAAALVSEAKGAPLPILNVFNTLKSLEKLGISARDRCSAVRIAVTGSVGKTSTKDMLYTVFKEQGFTHRSLSSYNNHWGVPLTLARMPQETQFGIFEVGMNHSGEIRPLSHMIKPQIAIITSVVECHFEFFQSEEDIARAKAEIFEGMAERGSVILNQDNPHFEFLSKRAQEYKLKVFSFGRSEKADFRLVSYKGDGEKSAIIAEIKGEQISYTLPVPGVHWAFNSLAVLGAVSLANQDVKKATQSLAMVEVPAGRGKCHKGTFTILDESYNANPTSMRAALSVLGQSRGGRKVAVIGDMREMGEIAQKRHEELFEPLLENKIDLVFCCGPHMAHLYERLPVYMKGGYRATSLELIPLVLDAVRAGDVISVKGSLGTRMKPIVDALTVFQKDFLKKVT